MQIGLVLIFTKAEVTMSFSENNILLSLNPLQHELLIDILNTTTDMVASIADVSDLHSDSETAVKYKEMQNIRKKLLFQWNKRFDDKNESPVADKPDLSEIQDLIPILDEYFTIHEVETMFGDKYVELSANSDDFFEFVSIIKSGD